MNSVKIIKERLILYKALADSIIELAGSQDPKVLDSFKFTPNHDKVYMRRDLVIPTVEKRLGHPISSFRTFTQVLREMELYFDIIIKGCKHQKYKDYFRIDLNNTLIKYSTNHNLIIRIK